MYHTTVIDWQPLKHHEFNKLSVRMSASTSVFPANALTIPRALSGSPDPVATYWPMLPSQVSHSSPTWALRKALLRVSLSAQRRRTSWRMISGKRKASCSSCARTTSNIGRSLLARREQVVRWTPYSALPQQASLHPTGRTCMCLVFFGDHFNDWFVNSTQVHQLYHRLECPRLRLDGLSCYQGGCCV